MAVLPVKTFLIAFQGPLFELMPVSLPTRELLLVTQFSSPGYQDHYRYTHGWPGGKHHEESALVGGGLPEHLSCPGQQQLNSFPWSMVFWAMTAICILIFVPQFYLFLCTTSLLQVLGHHLICRLVYEFLGSCLCLKYLPQDFGPQIHSFVNFWATALVCTSVFL